MAFCALTINAVDVREWNINGVLRVIQGRSQHLPRQLRNEIDNAGVEAREPLQFLKWLSVRADLPFYNVLDSPGLCSRGKP